MSPPFSFTGGLMVMGKPAAMVESFAVGYGPNCCASDGAGHIAVANFSDNSISVLNASTGAVISTLTTATSAWLAYMSEPGFCKFDGSGKLWISNFGNAFVEVTSLDGTTSGTEIAQGNTENCYGLELDAGTGTAWIVLNDVNEVQKINSSTYAIVTHYATGNGPVGVRSDGTNIWVTNLTDGTITILTLSSGTALGTSPFNCGTGSQPTRIDYDGTYMYVACAGTGKVLQILASTQTLVASYTTGTPLVSVACDASGNVWANDNATHVYKITTATMTKVGPTITVGQQSSVACYDSAHGGIWVPDELNELVYRVLQ